MTVAHDNLTEAALFTTVSPFDFIHVPVSTTPEGVMVAIAQGNNNSTDTITGVTYGGVAMTRIATAADTATEQGRSYIYFLGASIPTGSQTVSITHGGLSNNKWAVAFTATAAADTEVVTSGILENDAADPQIVLNTGATSALRYTVIYTGLGQVADLTLLSGMTVGAVEDAGAFVFRTDRETTASTGSFTIGYTAASDDVAMCAVAIQEVAGGGAQSLTGSLFTKAPTFFTGTVTATRALTGVLFQNAPTFPTGAVSLAAGPQTLTGTLFTKAPTFPTGVVTATYALTGTLFQKAPTFPQGAVTVGAVTLTGTLFTKAPTFPQGAITTGAVSLTGVLFQKAPTFFTGTVTAGAINLTGTLFVKAPTFFTGTIGQAGTLFGTLYVNTPVFFTGTMGQLGGSFWRPNPVAYTLAPVGYTPIGPNDIPPWGIDIQGVVFVKAPTFPVGTVS